MLFESRPADHLFDGKVTPTAELKPCFACIPISLA